LKNKIPLKWRSTVLSLPLQLVFLGSVIKTRSFAYFVVNKGTGNNWNIELAKPIPEHIDQDKHTHTHREREK
jgi:hypothetical protein